MRRFANATSVDELLVNAGRRDSIIDAYRPYLHQRWNEGCTDAALLYSEIRQRGFTGSDQTVRRYVRPSAPASSHHPLERQPRRPATSHDGS